MYQMAEWDGEMWMSLYEKKTETAGLMAAAC
jgi:hypothetical protein